MAKFRKDPGGRILQKGETYESDRKLYRYSYSDQFGQRRSIYSHDLGELRDRKNRLVRDKLDGLDIYTQGRADVNYVFDRYISTKTELRSSTRANYIYTFDRYVRDGFGKKKIAEVRYSDVLIFYNAMLEKGLKVNTVDSVHSVLHPTFQLAVRDNIIRNNPSDGVMAELKKKHGNRGGVRHALGIAEEQEFLKFLERPEYARWRPLFVVMFGTGCRVGEIISLRWCDVDYDKNQIRIDHSVTYHPKSEKSFKCEYELNLPKTEAGIRYVPLLDKVRKALELEEANQKEQGYHNTVELDGMSGFIFCNRFGGFHNPSGINRAIKRIVENHNSMEEVEASRDKRKPLMIPKFSCHITRHTFCTRLCENETNVKVIQSVMGHKDIQTTLDIYAEVSEMKKQEVFKKLNENNVV